MKAAAHITGGGLPGNLPRVLPDGTGRGARRATGRCRRCSPGWRAPAASRPTEMLRVFNCGIGMVLVVADADAAAALLRSCGESAGRRIGTIAAAAGAEPRCSIDAAGRLCRA